MPSSFSSPIARKLVWSFILLSTIVALFSTIVQTYIDYRHEINNIKSYLSSLEKTYLPSIAKNTWLMDDAQIITLLEGITNRNDIVYAAIAVDNNVRWSSGHKTNIDKLQTNLPILYTFHDKVKTIGTLTVIADLKQIYNKLLRHIAILLLTNTVKTFVVGGLALLLVQQLITRHLQTMASHVAKISFDKPQPPLKLQRKPSKKPDELDAVADALSSMQKRGYESYNALAKGEQRLRLFLDSTEEGVFGVDKNGSILFANAKCLEIIGQSTDRTIIGKPMSDVFSFRRISKTNAKGHNFPLHKAILSCQTFSCEDSYLNCAGKSCFFSALRAYPTYSNGTCSGAVVFFHDTSDERAMQYQMKLLQEAMNNSPVAILIADRDFTIEYVNPGFEKGSGYSRSEVVGKNIKSLSKENQFLKGITQASVNINQGKTWQGEICYTNRNNQQRTVSVIASPLFSPDGEVSNLVAVSRDITNEIELQEQLIITQRLEAMSRLSASIAHEFGNPLIGIRSLLKDFQERLILSRDDETLLDIAESECGRMQALIGDFQDFYGADKKARAFCDIGDAIDKIMILHQKIFIDQSIKTVINHTKELPKLFCRKDQITQVILNLIINAVDAMTPDGGTLTITTSLKTDKISIAIEDTGCGISREDQEHIFEPFFSTKPEVEGTGLGLSVSFGIVSTHGGNITCSSRRGVGSTFTILLPV